MVAARLKVPLLEDKLEEHQSWIFDTVAKKTLVQRLFTLMTGSVVTSEIGAKGSSKRGAAKQKAKTASKKAKSAPKAGTGNLVQAAQLPALPEDVWKSEAASVVNTKRGVRNKLWIDDVLRIINHIISFLRRQPCLSDVPQRTFDKLKSSLLRLCLVFAFKGEATVQTPRGARQQKKWSGLRTALQGHAWQDADAGVDFVALRDQHGSLPGGLLGPGECEEMYVDEKMTEIEKLNSLVHAVDKWLQQEPANPLQSQSGMLVQEQTTFGRMLAALRQECTCVPEADNSKVNRDNCYLHCAEPSINDLLYDVTLVVWETFGDEWACFVNLAVDLTAKGSPSHKLIGPSLSLSVSFCPSLAWLRWTNPSTHAASVDPKQQCSRALQELNLGAGQAVAMTRIRTAYIMNLLGELVSESAVNLKELWPVLEKKAVQDILVQVDGCLMSGHGLLCAVWTSCMADLLTTGSVDAAQVLATNHVRPVTDVAKKCLQNSGGAGAAEGAQGSDDTSACYFTVTKMIEFGADDLVPPADVLASLRCKLKAELLDRAHALEAEARDLMTVMVTLTEDNKNRAVTNHALFCKVSEDGMDVKMSAIADAGDGTEIGESRLPKSLSLMFFGDVGEYTVISAAEGGGGRGRASVALRPGKPAQQVPLRIFVDEKPYGRLFASCGFQWSVEAAGMNNMEGSVFCPAWLVPQVADNELPNMIYSTGEFTMKHMLPVKKDEGLQLEEKVVKVIFPMLVASEDVACRRAVFKNENGDALTKMCRGLLPGETRKTSSKKKLEDPSGSKDSSAAGSKDADSDAVVSASKTGAGASAAIAKAFSAAKMNSSELVACRGIDFDSIACAA
eukprot:s1135_g4.t2